MSSPQYESAEDVELVYGSRISVVMTEKGENIIAGKTQSEETEPQQKSAVKEWFKRAQTLRKLHAMFFYSSQIAPRLLRKAELTPQSLLKLYVENRQTYYSKPRVQQVGPKPGEEFSLTDVLAALDSRDNAPHNLNEYRRSELDQAVRHARSLIEAVLRSQH